MAVSTVRSKNGCICDENGSYMEFIADTTEDILELPTGNDVKKTENQPRPGSMALCVQNGSVYILSNSRKWEVFMEGNK